jgi:hypothetical protein
MGEEGAHSCAPPPRGLFNMKKPCLLGGKGWTQTRKTRRLATTPAARRQAARRQAAQAPLLARAHSESSAQRFKASSTACAFGTEASEAHCSHCSVSVAIMAAQQAGEAHSLRSALHAASVTSRLLRCRQSMDVRAGTEPASKQASMPEALQANSSSTLAPSSAITSLLGLAQMRRTVVAAHLHL